MRQLNNKPRCDKCIRGLMYSNHHEGTSSLSCCLKHETVKAGIMVFHPKEDTCKDFVYEKRLKFRVWVNNYEEVYYLTDLYMYEGWPTQQWTGMNDCNGKEIYEGDLVSFKVNTLAEILSFENQEVKYLDEYAMFIFGDYCLRDYIIHESIEVTGNIYE